MFLRTLLLSLLVGSTLCSAQNGTTKLPDTEIYLLDMQYVNGAYTFSNAQNITNRAGYSNQPAFSPDGTYLLYSAVADGKQADIYKYEIDSKATTCLAKTPENEFAPNFMPDAKNYSVVRVMKDKSQRVWKAPLGGGSYTVLTNRLDSIAYHMWWVDNTLLLNFIKKPPFLGTVSMQNGREHFISDVAGRCLQPIPGETSFTFHAAGPHKDSAGTIRKVTEFFEIGIICPALAGSEDFVWTSRKTLLMAKDSKLFEYDFSPGTTWKEVADFAQFGIKGFYRIALDSKNNRMAVVTYKGERP